MDSMDLEFLQEYLWGLEVGGGEEVVHDGEHVGVPGRDFTEFWLLERQRWLSDGRDHTLINAAWLDKPLAFCFNTNLMSVPRR